MALAVSDLIKAGAVRSSVWRAPVAAVSVGVVQGDRLLDLCYQEDSQAEVDLNVVMDGHGRYVEVQGTAEGMPFEREVMDDLLNLAEKGIKQLLAAQKKSVGLKGCSCGAMAGAEGAPRLRGGSCSQKTL